MHSVKTPWITKLTGLFGWDKPAAKPWHYDKDGNPRLPQPKKNEPER